MKAHLKSPSKSFKLGHVALAFVTLMLRNIADAVELEVGEEISHTTTKKNGVVDSSRLLL